MIPWPKTDRPELAEALRKSVEAYERMTPEQKAEMWRKQKESWVRGEMGMND